MNCDNVPAMAASASQFGPDFYAVLLVSVITSSAGLLLFRVQTRTPKLPSSDLLPYRLFFYASFSLGFFVVLASVSFWFYRQTHGPYTLQFAITDLGENMRIDSPYFSKSRLRRNSDASLVADDYFLIVQNSPFAAGQEFYIDVSELPLNAGAAGANGVANKHKSIKIGYAPQVRAFIVVDDPTDGLKLEPTSVDISANQPWFSKEEIAANLEFSTREKLP